MIIIVLFDIDIHIFTVIKFLFNLGVRIKYIFSLRSPAQQSLIETHQSVDLGTPIDITDDTSSTLVCILDQDINDIVDNSSVTSESQSIDINSRNFNQQCL